MANQIKCPKCGESFEPGDAYKHELEESIRKETETKHKTELDKLKQEIEESSKKEIEKAKAEAKENVSKDLKDKDEQIGEWKERAEKAEKEELQIRKEKRELAESKRKFELEKQRQIDEERDKIRSKALEEAQEEQELKDKEKDMLIKNLKKDLADAQRRAQQGSQQTQGEVMELELEELLKQEFPLDNITEVKKGQRGADVVQEVIDKKGRNCGVILWESKNAKWQNTWIATLKENQRQAKAQIAVLVSQNTPEDIDTFIYKEGVWIANRKMALPLALALRFDLVRVTFEKLANVNKSEKAEILYQYITSTDFKHRIEAIVETFADMQDTIEKEKRWFTSKWAKQKKQIRRVVDNTVGMRADLEGLVGNALPAVDYLELPDQIEEE